MKLKPTRVKRVKRRVRSKAAVPVPAKRGPRPPAVPLKPRKCKFARCDLKGKMFVPHIESQMYCSYKHKNRANQDRLKTGATVKRRGKKFSSKPLKISEAA